MTTPNVTSVRLTILEAIISKFTDMRADQPPTDPYGITWSTVELGPLISNDQKKRYSFGLVAGRESSKFSMPYVENLLTCNAEFRVTVNRDDDSPGVMIENALTVVQRGLTEDRTWGGICIDTKIVNSEIDLLTYADRSAVGVVTFTLQYRHGYSDPRDPNPDYG